MGKSSQELRTLADRILEEARQKAKELRAKADEIEAQEDRVLLKKLRTSGRLQALKDEFFSRDKSSIREQREKERKAPLEQEPALFEQA